MMGIAVGWYANECILYSRTPRLRGFRYTPKGMLRYAKTGKGSVSKRVNVVGLHNKHRKLAFLLTFLHLCGKIPFENEREGK